MSSQLFRNPLSSLLIESNLEIDLMLPYPLLLFYAISPIFNSNSSTHTKNFIVCSSTFEKAYIDSFNNTSITTALIDTNVDDLKPFLNNDHRLIISDLSLFVTRLNIDKLVNLLQGIEEKNIKNTTFIIRSDLITDKIFLSGIRRLFSSHLLLSRHEEYRLLSFYQYLHKGSIRSEKNKINISINTIEPFTNEHLSTANVQEKNDEQQPLPTSSFILGTTTEQKIQRSEVQLPFMKAQINNLVEYIPDEADDLDEEDPDADLEF